MKETKKERNKEIKEERKKEEDIIFTMKERKK